MKLKKLCILFICFISFKSAIADQLTQGTGKDQPSDSVITFRNLRYAPQPDSLNGDTSSDKLLDLYLPAINNSKKLPIFVFVHGGGFAGGDKYNKTVAEICSKLASKGFAVLSINYWLSLKHNKIPGASASANMAKGVPSGGEFHPGLQMAIQNASDDLVSVFRWVKKHKKDYHLDVSKLAISGGSAGAMTVLHTAYVSGQRVLPVQAVVDLWGGLEDASVIKRKAPPVLIYHGDQDKLIHVDFGHALKKRMDEIGDTQSILHVMEGKGHAMYRYIADEKIDEIAQFLISVVD
ncbi:alpha/beta hydrolase [Albibacterium indicum]|uniref:alpha/beta hydrolase n=1 Tax=Albibacterium indicum TaxID=2292082 RepID=UPI0013002FBD|nr:alpha/beta hydrolase [Pedobacter indicus]